MFGVEHANALVTIALWAFPLVAVLVFRLVPVPLAATVLLIGGEMFLPAGGAIDLPGLPAFGKDLITYTTVFACTLAFAGRRIAAARPGTSLELLALVMAAGQFGTALTNTDPLQYGPRVIPGIPFYEAPTAAISDILAYGLPFLLGRALHRDVRDLHRLLSVLALAGVVYSLFGFVEMALSPQFHNWVYGFIPFAFDQTWRWGGFRPVVFMAGSLAYAIFMATTLLAATALARARLPIGPLPPRLVAPYLLVCVQLSRSLAVMVWGALLAPLLWIARPRIVAAIALGMALLVAFYPLLRMADLVSWQTVTRIAERIDPERARSFGGRFEVEGKLLEKARERFVFGWGGYSRNWTYDPVTGAETIVPDGAWVLRLGAHGVVGFATDFGLSVIPVLVAWRRFGRIRGRREQILVAALMLIVGLRLVDLIPNGRWSSLPVFLAGALHATSKHLASARARREAAPPVHAPAAAAPAAPVPKPAPPASAPIPRRLSDTLRRPPEPRR